MNRRSVVIVDDLAELRQILRLILEHGGPFRVVGEGRDGEEAVALAAEHHPDLLLIDVEMPGGPSGWDVLPRVRDVAPETRVVILSGSRGDDRPSASSSLAAAVLEKGLSPTDLNAALLRVLGDDRPAPSQAEGQGVTTADDALVSAAARIERQQRDLVRSSAELEAFAAVAGHDLAQPLQVAYGYLEMLRTDFGASLDPTAASWLDAAVGSLDRMRALVQAVLGYARAGARPPRVVHVDLTEALEAAVETLPAEVADLPRDVRHDALPIVQADREHLVTILRHLVDNAVRFSPRGSVAVVEVSAEETTSGWTVAVVDRGLGIPDTLGDRAFDAFQRGGSSPAGGAGLGLAVCRKLVEAVGGRIWFEPPREGAGAEVRFTLPRDGLRSSAGPHLTSEG